MPYYGIIDMHRNIIKHFLTINKDLILRKSLRNCHCYGVDSILLDDTPGARIRIFHATEFHHLWKNYFRSGEKMSVAFHPHHCDLTLWGIKGNIINIQVEPTGGDPLPWSRLSGWDITTEPIFRKFEYQSKILSGNAGFKPLGFQRLKAHSTTNIGPGSYLEMKAQDLHTIFVHRGESATWAVYEGKEDPNYQSVCYSNIELDKEAIPEVLYQPMGERYLMDSLQQIFPGL